MPSLFCEYNIIYLHHLFNFIRFLLTAPLKFSRENVRQHHDCAGFDRSKALFEYCAQPLDVLGPTEFRTSLINSSDSVAKFQTPNTLNQPPLEDIIVGQAAPGHRLCLPPKSPRAAILSAHRMQVDMIQRDATDALPQCPLNDVPS